MKQRRSENGAAYAATIRGASCSGNSLLPIRKAGYLAARGRTGLFPEGLRADCSLLSRLRCSRNNGPFALAARNFGSVAQRSSNGLIRSDVPIRVRRAFTRHTSRPWERALRSDRRSLPEGLDSFLTAIPSDPCRAPLRKGCETREEWLVLRCRPESVSSRKQAPVSGSAHRLWLEATRPSSQEN